VVQRASLDFREILKLGGEDVPKNALSAGYEEGSPAKFAADHLAFLQKLNIAPALWAMNMDFDLGGLQVWHEGSFFLKSMASVEQARRQEAGDRIFKGKLLNSVS
jgi:hypothetical protein